VLYGTGKKFKDFQDLKSTKAEIEAHYIPRIKQMHRVLKATGSIYLQMDTKINHLLRVIMDEHFIFRNEIVWNVEYRLRQQTKRYTEFGERILFYTKSDNYYFSPPQVKHQTTKEHQERCRNTPSVMSGKFKTPFRDTKNAGDVWNDIKPLTYKSKENTNYDTQKPKKLIERIINASSQEGDTVADYYMGSGTTAIVCSELNRNFVGCDINQRAVEITERRLVE
jgi:site-specific DNA-methyltransferase (adenine-specific)